MGDAVSEGSRQGGEQVSAGLDVVQARQGEDCGLEAEVVRYR